MQKTEWLIFGATFLGCSFAILKEIISDKGSFDEELFTSNEMFHEKKDLSFQFITHSVACLKELASIFSNIKDDIMSFLKEKFVDNVYDPSALTLNIKARYKLSPSSFDYSYIIRNFILS